jgi:hypothetical protein
MKIDNTLKFGLTDWNNVPEERHNGITGYAIWKVQRFGYVRVRMVQYSENYLADHWCHKGHIILCIDGAMTTELKDGRKFELRKGMSYQVGDDAESHRSFSKNGVKLFIVD